VDGNQDCLKIPTAPTWTRGTVVASVAPLRASTGDRALVTGDERRPEWEVADDESGTSHDYGLRMQLPARSAAGLRRRVTAREALPISSA